MYSAELIIWKPGAEKVWMHFCLYVSFSVFC